LSAATWAWSLTPGSLVKSPSSKFPRAHGIRCPVYDLDPALQDGKRLSKWDSKAHHGIFVGFSDKHSSLVLLIFNPCTQHTLTSDKAHDVKFADLFETSCELYVVPLDVNNSHPLLHGELLLPENRLDPLHHRHVFLFLPILWSQQACLAILHLLPMVHLLLCNLFLR